ncbi:suppressor of kinetochore protein 1-like [Galendromus occidentalis]|uniref:Suppressor of kinetochore protein 1-like n=1 Tax=Galendromus occidentalis TaxID=34638 RepID=A0AAJ6QSC8_9ACAR|nr:suppressor of kinetochore protein 1-like [Galendromus occidentalis]
MNDGYGNHDAWVQSRFRDLQIVFQENGLYLREDSFMPLLNISPDCLRKILKWVNRHKQSEADLTPNEIKALRDWETSFLSVDKVILFDLIAAAQHLEMSDLVECAQKVLLALLKRGNAADIRLLLDVDRFE